MNPKKYKVILESLYSELDVDKTLISDIIDFYWSHVRKSISQVTYSRINIENLGVFELKLNSLQNTINKYQNTLNNIDSTNFKTYTKYMYVKNRLEVLEKAKLLILEEKDRKKQIKTNRYGNNIRGMEEKREDS